MWSSLFLSTLILSVSPVVLMVQLQLAVDFLFCRVLSRVLDNVRRKDEQKRKLEKG